MAPTRTRCPRGNAVQSWRLPASISAMLRVTESEKPTSAPPLCLAFTALEATHFQHAAIVLPKRSHIHTRCTWLGITLVYTCPFLFCRVCTITVYNAIIFFQYVYLLVLFHAKKKTTKGSKKWQRNDILFCM